MNTESSSVTDADAQAAVDTLPVDQQQAVELCRAELSSIEQQPEMTDPTQIRQLFESWGGGTKDENENDFVDGGSNDDELDGHRAMTRPYVGKPI